MSKSTMHGLYKHINPQTQKCVIVRIGCFLTFILTYPDPFLFSDSNSDYSPHMKFFMVGSSYH